MELVTEKGGIHKQVIVHPIVLLSIVDHYNRSAKGRYLSNINRN